MFRFFVQRLLFTTLPLLLLVSVIAFGLVYVLPGDVTNAILGSEAPRGVREELREQLGLNRPVYVQYLEWLSGAVKGDFGKSLVDNVPITTIVRQRLPITLELLALTMLLSALLALPLGILAARFRGGVIDHAASFLAMVGLSVPHFWLGILAILFVATYLRGFPTSGYVALSEDPLQSLKYMLLPALVTSLREAGVLMRFTRSSLLDVLRADYIRTAAAKGVNGSVILRRHALRNALLPVITAAGLQAAALAGGLVITETIFVIPGFGRLVLDSILARDVPVLLAAILIIAAMVLVINLFVDLLYAAVDPRIELSGP